MGPALNSSDLNNWSFNRYGLIVLNVKCEVLLLT